MSLEAWGDNDGSGPVFKDCPDCEGEGWLCSVCHEPLSACDCDDAAGSVGEMCTGCKGEGQVPKTAEDYEED